MNSILAVSPVMKRRKISAPAHSLDGFLDFGKQLLEGSGSFRGRAFLFLFWGGDETLTQSIQIGGEVKPTLVAKELVTQLRPDSFVLIWEAWWAFVKLSPGQTENDLPRALESQADKKEVILTLYRSRSRTRMLRQRFHRDERNRIAFDELVEEDVSKLSGLVMEMGIPEVPAYR